MPLLLRCGLCGRTQADGLLSRGYWGHLAVENGPELHACPTCKGGSDWEARLTTIAVVSADGRYDGPATVR